MRTTSPAGRFHPGRRLSPCALLAALIVATSAARTPRASAAVWPSDAGALARAVALAYENEERGTVAFDVTQTSAIRGGPFHRDDLDVTAFAESDGKLVHKAVLRHVEGGKSEDRAALAKREAGPEPPLGRFGLRLPCDPAAQADYAFDAPKPQGEEVVLPFRARVRDQAHGDGQIVLEPGGARIASIELTPALLPERASAASVSITFGPLAPARYGIVRIVRTFEGHVGPLHGRVTSTSSYGNVRVFASASAAAEAIERER